MLGRSSGSGAPPVCWSVGLQATQGVLGLQVGLQSVGNWAELGEGAAL